MLAFPSVRCSATAERIAMGSQRQRRGQALPRQQQHRLTRRSLLPALEVPNSPYQEEVIEQQSPAALLPMDAAAKQLVFQSIDDFILQLPLGADSISADIEAAVAAELLDLHLANYQLKQRLVKWTSATQELQDLVQEQQFEIRQLQQPKQQQSTDSPQQQQKQHQLTAANAELRQQLQGATSTLQAMESAMKELMEQQSLGANLEASKLVAERDAAAAQLAEARSTATAAQQDAARLRHALLDAEIDTQNNSVAAHAARQKVAELEAELSRARTQVATAKAEAESHVRKLAAAESAAAACSAQLLEAQAAVSKAQLDATRARQDAEQQLSAVKLQCQGCAEKAGQILELQDELQGVKASHIRLEMAVQQEQRASRGLIDGLDECKADLDQARGELADVTSSRDQLYVQLYGRHTTTAATGSGAAMVYAGCAMGDGGMLSTALDAPLLLWGSAAGSSGHSPVKRASYASGTETQQQQHMKQQLQQQHMQLGQQPPGQQEGLIQKYGSMQLQLQEQDAELRSLRQQMLDLQLQLSDAQSAADIAKQQLEQTKVDLEAASAAQQQASAAAVSASSTAEQLRKDLRQAQLQLQQQLPELAAATAQVDRLEAQQKVLLSDMQESMDAAAAATAAQAAIVAEAETLQKQLTALQDQFEHAQKQSQEEQATLLHTKEQAVQQLAIAEAAARTALQEAAVQHQQQVQQLATDHAARVDMLRRELAADATHRADTESKLQALQLEHAKQLAQAHAETQQVRAQQQSLQKNLENKESETQQLNNKLANAEKALEAAQKQAEAQLAAAAKAQQALRQQLLEVRGERLQLHEKLAALQSSSGSGQQLVQQMLAAQQDAAAVAAELRQQLQQSQGQVQEQQTQLQALKSDKTAVEKRLAEAVAAKAAAARQAAAAGEKLAVAITGQEALKQQVEALGQDVVRQSWNQQQQQHTYKMPAAWQPQQLQHHQLYAGSPVGSHSPSLAASPYRLGQLEMAREQLNKLAQTLAERDAELSELSSELQQAQAENEQLYEQQQTLKAELAILQGTPNSRGTQEHHQSAQSAGNTGRAGMKYRPAQQVQYAVTELAQLTEAMEALEDRLAQQAAATSRARVPTGAVMAESVTDHTGKPDCGSSRASPGNPSEALVAAAIAVADLRREVQRLSTELRDEEHTEQLQHALNGVAQPVQDVQSLRNMVRQLSTELTEKESLLSVLPQLQQQLAELSTQLAQKEREAINVAALRQEIASLQQQLAAAQAETTAAVAAAAAEGSNSSSRDSATLNTLLMELMQLKKQLDEATARDVGAVAEAAQLKQVVKDLQEQLQASSATLQQMQAAKAEVQAVEAAREQLQVELRFLQSQFEDVTVELHRKEEQLQLQQVQVLSMQQQLTAAETAATDKLQQQSKQLQSLQQQLAEAQAREASARNELETARHQLQEQLQQQQEQLQQEQLQQEQLQQEQVDMPSSTVRKMQSLLIQKDCDIQKLQRQLQDQQLRVEQFQEQLQLRQSLPPSARPSVAGEDAATAVTGSRQNTQNAAVAAAAAPAEHAAAHISCSGDSSRWAAMRTQSMNSAAAAEVVLASGRSSMRSNSGTRQDAHNLQGSLDRESLSAAAAGQQLPSLQPAATGQPPQELMLLSQPAGSSSMNANGSSRMQTEGLGGLNPKHIQQSLRSTSSNNRSGSGSTGRGSGWSNSSTAVQDERDLFANRASRPLSLAASRAHSIGRDMPSPSLFPAKTNSGTADTTGSSAAVAAAAHVLRGSSDSGWGDSSSRDGGSNRPASKQAATGSASAVEPLQLQLLLSSPEQLRQQPWSEGLHRSPSKRAAAALAAQGLARLPSSTATAAAAQQGQSYSRVGSLKWDGEASPAAMYSDARTSRAPAVLEKSTGPSTAPSQLTSAAGSRALSRQVSRAAAAAAAASGLQMPAVAPAVAPESMFISSSDEDDDRDTVGVLGGIGGSSSSSNNNNRQNTGITSIAQSDAQSSYASNLANSAAVLSRTRSASDLQYTSADGSDISCRSRSMNICNSRKAKSQGVQSATGAYGAVSDPVGVGSLGSGIGSLNSAFARQQTAHRLSDDQHSKVWQSQDEQTGSVSYSRSTTSSSRAKLLVSSSQGGYDAQKLQKSLSANSRQLALPSQQHKPETAAAVAPLTPRRRAMSATGATSAAGSTSNTVGIIHSSSTSVLLDRLNQTASLTSTSYSGAVSRGVVGQQAHRASSGAPVLKPALSRAARVAGVMASGRGSLHSSVSFKEPIRSSQNVTVSLSTSSDDSTITGAATQTADSTIATGVKAATELANITAAGSEKALSRSSSRRQQAVLQTAARLLEASDSD